MSGLTFPSTWLIHGRVANQRELNMIKPHFDKISKKYGINFPDLRGEEWKTSDFVKGRDGHLYFVDVDANFSK